MYIFHWLVYVAIAATIFSLGSGIISMVLDGDEGEDSVTWMGWRVGWQAVAVLFVVVAAYAAR